MRNLDNLLPFSKGESISGNPAFTERINATMEAVKALARGENIEAGPGLTKTSAEGMVSLSSMVKDTPIRIRRLPFDVYRVSGTEEDPYRVRVEGGYIFRGGTTAHLVTSRPQEDATGHPELTGPWDISLAYGDNWIYLDVSMLDDAKLPPKAASWADAEPTEGIQLAYVYVSDDGGITVSTYHVGNVFDGGRRLPFDVYPVLGTEEDPYRVRVEGGYVFKKKSTVHVKTTVPAEQGGAGPWDFSLGYGDNWIWLCPELLGEKTAMGPPNSATWKDEEPTTEKNAEEDGITLAYVYVNDDGGIFVSTYHVGNIFGIGVGNRHAFEVWPVDDEDGGSFSVRVEGGYIYHSASAHTSAKTTLEYTHIPTSAPTAGGGSGPWDFSLAYGDNWIWLEPKLLGEYPTTMAPPSASWTTTESDAIKGIPIAYVFVDGEGSMKVFQYHVGNVFCDNNFNTRSTGSLVGYHAELEDDDTEITKPKNFAFKMIAGPDPILTLFKDAEGQTADENLTWNAIKADYIGLETNGDDGPEIALSKTEGHWASLKPEYLALNDGAETGAKSAVIDLNPAADPTKGPLFGLTVENGEWCQIKPSYAEFNDGAETGAKSAVIDLNPSVGNGPLIGLTVEGDEWMQLKPTYAEWNDGAEVPKNIVLDVALLKLDLVDADGPYATLKPEYFILYDGAETGARSAVIDLNPSVGTGPLFGLTALNGEWCQIKPRYAEFNDGEDSPKNIVLDVVELKIDLVDADGPSATLKPDWLELSDGEGEIIVLDRNGSKLDIVAASGASATLKPDWLELNDNAAGNVITLNRDGSTLSIVAADGAFANLMPTLLGLHDADGVKTTIINPGYAHFGYSATAYFTADGGNLTGAYGGNTYGLHVITYLGDDGKAYTQTVYTDNPPSSEDFYEEVELDVCVGGAVETKTFLCKKGA